MKHFLVSGFFILASACTKQDIGIPSAVTQTISAVAYQDDFIAVSNFKAEKEPALKTTVSFTTLYEKSIRKIELMRGSNDKNFCRVYEIKKSGDSNENESYSYTDNGNNNATCYYMIRYTLVSGDWGYTPVYKLQ